ncbi:MAG: PaaI family thioesterase [Oscillospiraceae bacterium]|nr:PaaI family thioesterase [Oscillospiraceae bacterium]
MSAPSLPTEAHFESALRAKLETLKSKGTLDSYMDPVVAGFDFAQKSLTLRFVVKPWMLNVEGIMHGGLYASMADCVMGSISCFWADSPITPTVSLHINFMRPAKCGDVLLFRGKLISAGRTMIHVSMEAYQEDAPEKCMATGTGVFFNPHVKDPAPQR